ncbi:MAG: YbbR-like domain-containing protein [Candidatus Omnitrophica bacterium]|nr:YbbR-like domain-containing protein [Candidatus Omnitrophota bacterium]
MSSAKFGNMGLKLVALGLAVITWLYVTAELNKAPSAEERPFLGGILPQRLMAKSVPVNVTIVGNPPQGYSISKEDISINPDTCLIVGHPSLVEQVDNVRTMPLDIREYSRPVIKSVELAPFARGITIEGDVIEVSIKPVKTKKDEAVHVPEAAE